MADIAVDEERMLDRISKVLNQAERAEEGSPEREAFMEKAMTLAQAYSIDLAVARSHAAKKEKIEEPEEREYKVGTLGKRAGSANKHMTDLFLAIAGTYDLRCMMSASNAYVFATGFPSDHELVERLFALLSVQMVAEADARLKRGEHKQEREVRVTQRVEIPEDERDWGGWDYKRNRYYSEREDWDTYQEILEEKKKPKEEQAYWARWYQDDLSDWTHQSAMSERFVKPHWPPAYREEPVLDEDGAFIYETKVVSTIDGRQWRANFYQGFIQKARARLWESKKQALRDAGVEHVDKSTETGLALLAKSERVEDAYQEKVRTVLATSGRKKLGTYEGAEVSRHHHGGRQAGEKAAQEARLGDEKDLAR